MAERCFFNVCVGQIHRFRRDQLNKHREKKGVLDFRSVEPCFEFDENRGVSSINALERNDAHRLIEEFMLAANEAVARYLEDKKYIFLRRVHPEPEPRKLRAFAEFAASLGLKVKHPQSRPELQQVIAAVLEQVGDSGSYDLILTEGVSYL